MRYLALALAGAAMSVSPAMAQPAQPAPAAAPQLAAGANVVDSTGAGVGTIESVTNGNATINTGTVKAAVPVASFAARDNGFAIGMTKAQLEAAVAQSKSAEIAVGSQVKGPQGAPVGTVESVAGDLVTVATAKTKAQLPKNAFAQAADGSLTIGMTATQLEAAAAQATGDKTS